MRLQIYEGRLQRSNPMKAFDASEMSTDDLEGPWDQSKKLQVLVVQNLTVRLGASIKPFRARATKFVQQETVERVKTGTWDLSAKSLKFQEYFYTLMSHERELSVDDDDVEASRSSR